MIEIVRKNLFLAQTDAIVIPVNCVGVMGAGVALQFRKHYPDGFAPYREACFKKELRPGEIMFHWKQGWAKTVIFFPTKDDWRKPSRIEWIRDGLKDLRKMAGGWGMEKSIAMPALGCGFGGLRWGKVKPLIEQEFTDWSGRVTVCLDPIGR